MVCDHMLKIENGRYGPVSKEQGDVEYESIAALGSYCENGDPEAVITANSMCNQYGIDTISVGNAIGFMMECIEKGIYVHPDAERIHLKFGNARSVVEMIEKIAKRQGIGDILAEGTKRVSEMIGSDAVDVAVQAGGMECPMIEPRCDVGRGLSYAVGNRGACHHQYSLAFTNEDKKNLGMENMPEKTDTSREHIRCVIVGENWRAVQPESLILCSFVTFEAIGMQEVIDYFDIVVGADYSKEDLMHTGERIYNLCRSFNVREGRRRKHDKIPKRFTEPMIGGPTNGMYIDATDFERMLDDFYEMRGWDVETGIPKQEKLKELELNFVVEELYHKEKGQ